MCVQQRQRWISLSFRQRAHPFGIDQPRELSARRWSYGRTFFSEPHHQQVRKQRAAPLCASALITATFCFCVCVCGCNSISDSHCRESCPGPAINETLINSVEPTATREFCWNVCYFQNLSQSKEHSDTSAIRYCYETLITGASRHGSKPAHHVSTSA
eukprot:SAG31_NODE_4313_length_3366_cov_3.879706_3_plen_158_part_00